MPFITRPARLAHAPPATPHARTARARSPAPQRRARRIHTRPPTTRRRHTRPPPPPPSRAPHHTYTHLSGAHPHTSPDTEHTARAPRANTAAYAHTALVAPLHTHVSSDTAMHPPQSSCLIYEGSVTASLARGVMWAAPEGSRPGEKRREKRTEERKEKRVTTGAAQRKPPEGRRSSAQAHRPSSQKNMHGRCQAYA